MINTPLTLSKLFEIPSVGIVTKAMKSKLLGTGYVQSLSVTGQCMHFISNHITG